MATTAAERGLVLRSPGRFLAAARDLIDLRGRVGAAADGTGTAAAVDCLVDAASYRARALATAGLVAGGEKVGPESSIDKLFWSELDLRIHRAALDLLGPAAELADGPAAVDRGRWLDGYLFALAGPIYAGTNEIQRGIVAQRVLGMARR
jgi:alkylation response protein AidB-like acyl-CoA dehydrogenase